MSKRLLRHRTEEPQGVTKTPPSSRKRKLGSTAVSSANTSTDSLPVRKASKTSYKTADLEEAALPATPQTLTSDKPMDSDDEVNSLISSEDIGGDDNSSVDFGAGAFRVAFLPNAAAFQR